VSSFLSGRADIIYPTIDPLDHKNRELSTHELTGTLTSAALAASPHPSLNPSFGAPALRLQPGGSFAPATRPEDFGLLFRPIITQISRWDHLKGPPHCCRGSPSLRSVERRSAPSAVGGERTSRVWRSQAPTPRGSTTIPRRRRSSERSATCAEG
jgi:hypothetical protein